MAHTYHPLTSGQIRSLMRGEASQNPSVKYAALRRAMQATDREMRKYRVGTLEHNLCNLLYSELSKRAIVAHREYERRQWGGSLDPVAVALARIAPLLDK